MDITSSWPSRRCWPPLNEEAARLFTSSERLLQQYASARTLTDADWKALIEDVLRNPELEKIMAEYWEFHPKKICPSGMFKNWMLFPCTTWLCPDKEKATWEHLDAYSGTLWECDFFNGRPSVRCYPFDLEEHRFQGENPQVKNAWDIMCDIICDVHHDITNATLYILGAGLCLPHSTISIQYAVFIRFRSLSRLWHHRRRRQVVCSARAFSLMQFVSQWPSRGCWITYRSVIGILQYVWANPSVSRPHYAGRQAGADAL